jgi:sugar/nucleoside kinase (ribokinase family)
MKEIIVIGDIFCDIIALDVKLPDAWGTDTLSKEIKVVAGGSALNVTVHAANYSAHLNEIVKLHLLSCTGNDFQGKVCRDALNHPCIDSSRVIVNESARTGSCIVLSGASDRSFVTDRGCIKDMKIDWFNQEELFSPTTSHIHIGGFYNCDTLQEDVCDLLMRAVEQNITTSLNPQYDATEKWEGIEKLCPYVTFFISNESELTSITKSTESSSTLKKAGILLNWGCQNVVITMGNQGAISFKNDGTFINQKAGIVEVVDTTGAGDGFAGGFLVEWANSHQMSSALRAGCISGSAAVTHIGGSKYSLESLMLAEASLLLLDLGS